MLPIDIDVPVHLVWEQPETGRKFYFKGATTDDFTGTDAHLCIAASGPPASSLRLKDGTSFLAAGGTWPVEVQWKADPTPINRQINALAEFSKESVNAGGVSAQSLLFGSECPKVTQNWLTDHLNNSQSGLDSFDEIVNAKNLNDAQRQAVESALSTVSGNCIVMGPPGTGKTRTSQAFVEAVVCALPKGKGRPKVLVVGPSNKSVDEGLSALERDKLPSSDIEAVRWRGGFLNSRAQTLVSDDTMDLSNPVEDVGVQLDFWDLVQSQARQGALPNSHLAFGIRKDAWIQRLRQTEVTMMTPAADIVAIIAIRDLDKAELALQERDISRAQRKKLQTEKHEIMENISESYLSNVVDVVYSTCSSSAHDLLRFGFRPDIIVFEEAGQINIGDVAVALGAHIETVKQTFFSGDYNQNRPQSCSAGRNEAGEMMSISVFEEMVEDPLHRYKPVRLNEQHRMAPEIGTFVGESFYHQTSMESGKPVVSTWLLNHLSVRKPQPIDFKIQKLLDPLRKNLGYKGTLMLGFDVPHVYPPYAQSSPYKNTTSWTNEDEAKLMLDFAEYLLQEHLAGKIDTDGDYVIKPKDIGIIVPYTGAQRDLTDTVYRQRQTLSGIDITTTNNVQGGEYNIVLCGFVMNNPSATDKRGDMAIGWIHERGQLNVEFSRAKRFIATFGNFTGWCRARFDGKSYQHGVFIMRNMKHFANMVNHFYDKDKIIDGPSALTELKGNPDKEELRLFKRGITAYASDQHVAFRGADDSNATPQADFDIQHRSILDLDHTADPQGLRKIAKKAGLKQKRQDKAAEALR